MTPTDPEAVRQLTDRWGTSPTGALGPYWSTAASSAAAPAVSPDGLQWSAAQAALRDEVDRVVALLRSVRRPAAPAVGDWNLAEVALHLSQAWIVVPGLASGDLSGLDALIPERAERGEESVIDDLWDLADLTTRGVRSDPERDPAVLADRIEQRAHAFFAGCAGRSAGEPRPWLVRGVTVPLSVLTGHLLNETVMHGRDVARADGRKWPISGPRAALVLDTFVVPVLRSLGPTAVVDAEKAAGVRATFDVRLRGGGRYSFVFDDGTLVIEEPSERRADCHLSVDPAAFLEVMWGRSGQWRHIATGRFTAWGRRPWLGPRLRSLMRNP